MKRAEEGGAEQRFNPDVFRSNFKKAVGDKILESTGKIPKAAMNILFDAMVENPSETLEIFAVAKDVVILSSADYEEKRKYHEAWRKRPVRRLGDTLPPPWRGDSVPRFEHAVIAELVRILSNIGTRLDAHPKVVKVLMEETAGKATTAVKA